MNFHSFSKIMLPYYPIRLNYGCPVPLNPVEKIIMTVSQFKRVHSPHNGNVFTEIYRYLLINRSFDYELARKVKICISSKMSMATVSMET